MTTCVIHDFDEDEAEHLAGDDRRRWFLGRARYGLVDSTAVVSYSKASAPWFDQPGLYFLIWHDLVCYVGKGNHISSRIQDHIKEGRPVEKIAVILGIPSWAQNEFEQAYIRAWDPPWNAETTRGGSLDSMPEFMAIANSLDRSKVMPHYPATISAAQAQMKTWELHVLGYWQHRGRTNP